MKDVLIKQRCLTWDELARLYDESNGYMASRTHRSGTIMAWARAQTKRFLINTDGVHLLVTK